MLEDIEIKDETYRIRTPAHPWQHIRHVGEDISVGEMILPRLSRIRENDLGAMASYGITTIPVLDLKVALIPTGNNIVSIGTVPHAGQVIESNMHMVSSLITAAGAKVFHYSVIPDDQEELRKTIKHATDRYDIILISAGSSKKLKGGTAQVIAELGRIFVHNIAIKPGKPVILGEINKKPVIGIPGYPTACFTVIREIVMPLLGWHGFSLPQPQRLQARLTTTLKSDIGFDEFCPCTSRKSAEFLDCCSAFPGSWCSDEYCSIKCIYQNTRRFERY